LVSKLRFADGRGAVNPKGLEYYNNLIDELVKNGKVCCTNLCNYNVPTTIWYMGNNEQYAMVS
jgi:beta-glucosidase